MTRNVVEDTCAVKAEPPRGTARRTKSPSRRRKQRRCPPNRAARCEV